MSTVPYSFKSTIWDYLYACVYASVCTCVCVCVPTHMFGKGHFQALQREAGICDQAVSTFPIWLGSCFSWPHRACFTPSLCVHLPPPLPPTPCWCSNLLYFLPLQAHSLECTFLLHGMCVSEPWAWFTHLLIQVLAKLPVSREVAPGTTGKTALLPPDTLPLPASFFFASLTTIQNRSTNLSAYCLSSPLEYKLQPDDAPCPGQHGHSVNAHFPSISHWALFKTAHAQVFRGYRRLDPWGTWKPSPHATPPKPHPPCVGSNLWPISLSLPLLRS